jgi:hypothetical protein
VSLPRAQVHKFLITNFQFLIKNKVLGKVVSDYTILCFITLAQKPGHRLPPKLRGWLFGLTLNYLSK